MDASDTVCPARARDDARRAFRTKTLLSFADAAAIVRGLFERRTETTIVGVVGILSMLLFATWYALSISPRGTLLAAVVWIAFTATLAWLAVPFERLREEGLTFQVVTRSVLGAVIFLIAIPTIVRLRMTTPAAVRRTFRSRGEDAFNVEPYAVVGVILLLLVLGTFVVWSVSSLTRVSSTR